MRGWTLGGLALVCTVAVGCGGSPDPDAGMDASADDAGRDAGAPDTGPVDDAGRDSGAGADAGPSLGSFGDACLDGTECASGICYPVAAGQGRCSLGCTDGSECVDGWACEDVASRRICTCAPAAETCNGLDDDCDGAVDEGRPESIGCGEGETCTSGTCSCPAPRMCGGRCVNTDIDPEHCGSCGNVCGLGDRCAGGSCCTPSTEVCNAMDDDCDGNVDEGGSIALGCGAGESCAAGACGCGMTCGAACIDTNTDRDHCGSCTNACALGLDCVGGVCCMGSGTRVDVLFMVDNSNSMAEEQLALAAQLPRMVRVLATGDLDGDGTPESEPVRDLHLGVVNADMGTGGFTVPTCARSDFGDDGILRTAGATSLGCMATYPSFIEFQPSAPGADPAAAATDFACVATMGVGGCGFEQQLEATLKALTPSSSPIRFFRSTTGHGDGANAGFLRPDSLLVAFLLTDENDCSASDGDVFNPSSSSHPGDLNLRCFDYPGALHPLTRYVDGLLALRADPRDLIYAAISGVPPDLITTGVPADYRAILSDPRMAEHVDAAMPTRLATSCSSAGGVAFPPRRIVRVAEELSDRGATGVLGSICQSDYTGPVDDVLRRISLRLQESCAAP